jgi:acetylornithine/succinyldiaminopimelate/putrescine aminotransferase
VGNPLAAAAALATLRVVREEKLAERAASLGERVMERLRAFAAEQPDLVLDVRGRGLLIGLALAEADHAAGLPRRAAGEGVLVNVTAGNVVRLFPALNVPEDDLFPALETVLGLIAE